MTLLNYFRSILVLIFMIPGMGLGQSFSGKKLFHELPEKERLELFTYYLDAIKSLEGLDHKEISFFFYYLKKLDHYILSSAWASTRSAYNCVYGGWPSKKVTMTKNGTTKTFCGHPKKHNHQYPKETCSEGQLLCNPTVFGPDVCINNSTPKQKNRSILVCEEKFKELGRNYENVIQKLPNPSQLDELFDTVDEICKTKNFNQAVCLKLKSRVERLIKKKTELTPKDVQQITQKLDDITKITTNDQKPQACEPGPECNINSFEDFIDYICQKNKLDEQALIEMKRCGLDKKISKMSNQNLDLESFREKYNFFRDENSKIAERFNTIPDKAWSIEMKDNQIQSNKGYNKESYFREREFGKLTFLGVDHLYSVPTDKWEDYKKAVFDKLKMKSPGVIVLEGYEYGTSLNCHQILNAVFAPDEEMDSEMRIAIKYGFMNKIALVPGDNLIIDPQDIATFFNGNQVEVEKVKKEILFINILHKYFSQLKRTSDSPLKDAIESSKASHVFNEESFKDYYNILNQRVLPKDPDEIYKDITPSAYLANPKGSNRLTDKLEDLRNRALLRAIQISNSAYKNPLILFGEGHLSALEDSIENGLKKQAD